MAWIEPVTLAGAHVVLEPAAERHHADLLAAGQDDLVWAWLPWARPRSEADVAAMIEGQRGIAHVFAQVEAASGRAVGFTTYRDIDDEHRTLEIGGTWIGRPWWRTAINTEAKLLLIGHAFETLGANRVALKTDIRNERSQAAIARLGAVREGVLRHQYVRRDGTLRDTVLYSIVPEEWPAREGAAPRPGSPRTHERDRHRALDRARQGHAARRRRGARARPDRRPRRPRVLRRRPGEQAAAHDPHARPAADRPALGRRRPVAAVPRRQRGRRAAGARPAREHRELRRPRRSAAGSSAARTPRRSPPTSGATCGCSRATRASGSPTTRR